MARYIDADKLKKLRDDVISRKLDVKTESDLIDLCPTADVVEVVRCKDCDVPHNKWLGCPHLNGSIPPPDFYCAKGTPKERGGGEVRAEEYKVIRTDFEHLEALLNKLDREYPSYHLYQILSEHSYDGALAAVILERND